MGFKRTSDPVERFLGSYLPRKKEEHDEQVAEQAVAQAMRTRVNRIILPMGSNPQKAMAVSNVYDLRRETTCSRYRDCLNYAEAKGWNGFHCEACKFGGRDA